jgi:Zinc-finger of C2H2 type
VSQINRYAAGWQLAGSSSEEAAGWQIVNPDDLIPVVDISAPVDAYSTGIPATYYPTTPASPQYYPQYPSPRTPEPYRSDDEICPQTPEYRPYSGDDNDDFNLPIDLTLSPTPIPRRAPASPTPPTPPSPPNPLRYRAGPAPPPPRPIKKISKRKAITIEQRALRAERKSKPREKKGRYCKVCKLECNSLVVFANHLKSRGHLYRSGLTPTLPRCDVCNRDFPDKAQLDHHKRGRAHLRVVVQTSK